MTNKTAFYSLLNQQAMAIIDSEYDVIANMANISALLFNQMDDVNWAGFYLFKENQLVLGPFQGQVACIRIPIGKGVCGTAAANRKTMRVRDVHEFAGHIACDAASNSEIVIPIVIKGELLGVLDIDSPSTERFDKDDQLGLENLIANFVSHYQNHLETLPV
jgi:GAF domain-containing protein